MRYTDAPNAQEMLKVFIDKCKELDIPCSGFQLSSGYSQADDGKRYAYAFPPRAGGESVFQLYEDDGSTMNYRRGEYQLRDLRLRADSTSVHVGSPVEVEWIMPLTETRQIVNG